MKKLILTIVFSLAIVASAFPVGVVPYNRFFSGRDLRIVNLTGKNVIGHLIVVNKKSSQVMVNQFYVEPNGTHDIDTGWHFDPGEIGLIAIQGEDSALFFEVAGNGTIATEEINESEAKKRMREIVKVIRASNRRLLNKKVKEGKMSKEEAEAEYKELDKHLSEYE